MWTEYQRRWPQEALRSRAGDDSFLTDDRPEARRRQVDAACDRIAVLGRDKISPAMRAMEEPRSRPSPSRFRGSRERPRPHQRERPRQLPRVSTVQPSKLFSIIPDTLRYTFQYREARYTRGVWMDIGRLNDQGFILQKLRIPGLMISTMVSTVSGLSRTVANGSRYSSIRTSATKPSSSRISPTSSSELRSPISPISSSRWCWKLSRRRSPPMFRFRPEPLTFRTTHREAQMPDKVTYYAVVDDLSSRERPAGSSGEPTLEDGGRSDEAFTRKPNLGIQSLLISAERGDLQNDFIEITEDEANQIVARIRARVTGQSTAKDA